MTPLEATTIARPIVLSTARRCRRPGVDFDDLVQEGFAAAISAARIFDPSRGVPFHGYVHRAIHGAVLRAMHVAQRRGLTPSHDYVDGKRPRALASMDAPLVSDNEPTTMHDFLGTTPALEDAIDLGRELAVPSAPPSGVRLKTRTKATATYRGRTQSLWAWSRELGIKYIVLYNRIVVKGWTAARSFETPVAKRQGGKPGRLKTAA